MSLSSSGAIPATWPVATLPPAQIDLLHQIKIILLKDILKSFPDSLFGVLFGTFAPFVLKLELIWFILGLINYLYLLTHHFTLGPYKSEIRKIDKW